VEEAADSVQKLHSLLKDLDEKRRVIPNRHAMQIYFKCCLKSVSSSSDSCAMENICFDAANFALNLMERHKCRFSVEVVVQILIHISLRVPMGVVAQFVQRLARKSLTHLPENLRLFLVRHLTFVMAERKEAVDESLSGSASFAETGLCVMWERSSKQKLVLYNRSDGKSGNGYGGLCYQPVEGYGFARKGLVAVLSMDRGPCERHALEYKHHRDGAIVEISATNEGEPLIVCIKTFSTRIFEKNAFYRLDNIETAEVHTKRVTDALSIVGEDSSPLMPSPYLCQMLFMPPEEPYSICLKLQPNNSDVCDHFDIDDDSNEPIRVRSIDSGSLFDWNQANPSKAIHIGDKILKVKDFHRQHWLSEKQTILDEIYFANTLPNGYDFHMVLAKKVKFQERGLQVDDLLPSAADTEVLLLKEQMVLAEKKQLNPSQMEAIRFASTHSLALIQGPPGTGKTTTAVELLCFVLDHKIVPTPILVSGHTNAAVDNILVGLAKKNKRIVRIGDEDKVRSECKSYLLGEDKAAEPENAEVICATCIASGNRVFHKQRITCHTVLIDEASQATETSCLVPICHGSQQLILIGDQCQLQPFVKAELVKSEDLGTSLFNRLCQQGVVPALLGIQYRMHPSICEFPSAAFYNEQLLSDPGLMSCRVPTKYWDWPSRTTPVSFIDVHDGVENDSDGKMEKTNLREVECVITVLKELLRDPKLTRASDDGSYPIGIVTPYAAQKESIMKQLKDEGFIDSKGKHLVETNSVDGFQGREKDVIIFSAVRANLNAKVGFLHDWRRINVMLTRAKSGLIVIGHHDTLATDVYWKNWLKWAASRGCIMGAPSFGKWVPRCLVEDEWVMKPRDSIALGIEQVLLGQQNAEIRSALQDEVWEDLAMPIKEHLSKHFLGSALNECTLESWEDAVSIGSTETEGLESSTEPNDETDQSSASCYSLDLETCEGIDSSGNEGACTQKFNYKGPLELMMSNGCDLESMNFRDTHEADQSSASCYSLDLENCEGIDSSCNEGTCTHKFNHRGSPEFMMSNGCDLQSSNLRDTMGIAPSMASQEVDKINMHSMLHDLPQPLPDERVKTSCDDYFKGLEQNIDSGSTDVQPIPLERFRTPNDFDADSACNMSHVGIHEAQFAAGVDGMQPAMVCAGFDVLNSAGLQHGSTIVDPYGVRWMAIPFYIHCGHPSIDDPTAHVASAFQQPSWLDMATLQQRQALPPLPNKLDKTCDTHGITCEFDATHDTYQILWRADSRRLNGDGHVVVSPRFDFPNWDQHSAPVFALIIHARHSNFSKSKGYGRIKFKCESEPDHLDLNIEFTITVGSQARGPVYHDFSSRPIAELSRNQEMWNLNAGRDAKSNIIMIRLDVRRTVTRS
jgi:hypothetical protein